jgi:hypothetical protein
MIPEETTPGYLEAITEAMDAAAPISRPFHERQSSADSSFPACPTKTTDTLANIEELSRLQKD